MSGAALTSRIDAAAEHLAALPPGLLFSPMPAETAAVIRYLAALATGRPIALLDPSIPAATLLDLIARFAPAIVAAPPAGVDAPSEYLPSRYLPAASPPDECWTRWGAPIPHPELSVLLTTSGSTGNPKLVRLAARAVLANARSVAEALRITPGDLWPTTLPLHYTYGLTTLNCHLTAGAGVLVTGDGLLARSFWALVDSCGATSLAAVPYQFEMLRRLRFDPAAHPKLRMITQSGARLRTELITDFATRMAGTGGHLVKMYGMTEAPRIAVLPPERLAEKLTSVGRAIPGGELSVDGGEVVYRGPNVMMGYAENALDLERGDDLGGVLRTGDLGHLDDEGYLYLDGRLKRIAKVFGIRVNLDDIERLLRGHGPVAAVSGDDDRIVVWAEGTGEIACRELAHDLATRLNVHWSGFDVRGIDRLPLLGTGKVDYRSLEARE